MLSKMTLKLPGEMFFVKNIWLFMSAFVFIMLFSYWYLNSKTILSNNLLLQNLFILTFGIGEILIILVGVFLSIKHKVIVLKKEDPGR